ncbi:MAG: hypothetical protein AAF389_13670 [Gemmatimonadota bacterium]
MIERVFGWLGDRVEGQVWWCRLPVLLFLGWVYRGYLEFRGGGSIFSGINLGFHEMGHALFFWSGDTILIAAGGTILEVTIPLAAGAYLAIRQRDPFGAVVCAFWWGTALVGVGLYAADARAQALPLVSPFGPVDVDSHDWTVILMKYGKLSRDQEIGGAIQTAGMTTMLVALIAGALVLRLMAVRTAKGAAERPPPSLSVDDSSDQPK